MSAGEEDIFLAKLDRDGRHLWSGRFGDSFHQAGTSLTVDPNGDIVLTGELAGAANFGGEELVSAGDTDVFVAKISGSGEHLWSKRFGGPSSDQGYAVAVDRDGQIAVVGSFYDTIQFGNEPMTSAGSNDVFIAKMNGFGVPMWSKRFGDSDHQKATTVAFDGNKNLVVAGEMLGTIDLDAANPEHVDGEGLFISKFDSVGNFVWSKVFGGAVSIKARSVATDINGAVYLFGNFDGSVEFGGPTLTSTGGMDLFVIKLDAAGNHVWSKQFGDEADQTAGGLAVAGAYLALTGTFSGTLAFGPQFVSGLRDVFIAGLDPMSGAALYVGEFKGDGSQQGLGVASDDTQVYVVGSFEGHTDFGKGAIGTRGQADLFLAKLAPF